MIAGVVASQITAVFSISPDTDIPTISTNPFISMNYTVSVGGTLYFEVTSDVGDGGELEYSINNGGYTFIYVTGAGYVSSQSISVSDGDTIKFRLGAYGYENLEIQLRNTNAAGAVLFYGAYESDV